MKYRRVFNRRTLLKGAGTIAIGLPFVDAMRTHSAFAASPEPPARAFNVFFGLGMPTPLQLEAFDGPMEPLSPLASKLCFVRGVDHVRSNMDSNAHRDGAAAAFTAEEPIGDSVAGGPSLDQVILRGRYAQGLPAGIRSVLMGTYFRRDRPARMGHSWRAAGELTDTVRESPQSLFRTIFGEDPSMTAGAETPEEARRKRLERSVLDSLLAQYQHYRSDASDLGAESRRRIANHFDRIRDYEQRVFGMPAGRESCMIPPLPAPSTLPHDDDGDDSAATEPDPGGQGIDITLEDLVGEWRLMAELYALGIECDLVRFGGATFQAAGERIRLTGRYEYGARLIYDFDDRRDRGGADGAQGCSHEFWHGFNESGENAQLRAHSHLMMREVAYFLGLLDQIHADENGLSVLDNALVTVSTESGDGRHNDETRELSGIFHAFTGANERFRTGAVLDIECEGLDLYNTMIEAMGVDERLGRPDRALQRIEGVLR